MPHIIPAVPCGERVLLYERTRQASRLERLFPIHCTQASGHLQTWGFLTLRCDDQSVSQLWISRQSRPQKYNVRALGDRP
jgi:hypothetical protein